MRFRLSGLVTASLMLLLGVSLAIGQERGLTSTAVFTRTEEGYHTYRIPALTVAADGTLLAIVEGRRDNASDPGGGHIDLVYKRSTDGGRSWSALHKLHPAEEGWGASNPTPVLERRSGRVFVFFNLWKPGRGGRNSRAGTRDNQVAVRYSDDHGKTWSDARDLTDAARDVSRWATVVLGPGMALDLGEGRLLVPAYAREMQDGDLVSVRSFALISDDGGVNWHRGERVDAPTGECQLVHLDKDRVLIDARQREGDHRWIAVSDDGGKTWSEPRPGAKATPVNTSILHDQRPDSSAGPRLLWTGPRGPSRSNLVLRISEDEGRTFPHERQIAEGRAAYSSMALLPDGTVGVLWERGQAPSVPGGTVPETVTFTRLSRPWIDEAGRRSRD